jgi:hypothetical protein
VWGGGGVLFVVGWCQVVLRKHLGVSHTKEGTVRVSVQSLLQACAWKAAAAVTMSLAVSPGLYVALPESFAISIKSTCHFAAPASFAAFQWSGGKNRKVSRSNLAVTRTSLQNRPPDPYMVYPRVF